jgi:hypothetical protein
MPCNVATYNICAVTVSKNWVAHMWPYAGKVQRRTRHEDQEGEYRCSSTLSLTSALGGDGRSRPRPGGFTPRNWYPFHRRLGGPQGRSGRVRNISLPPGFDLRTIQPVASPYKQIINKESKIRHVFTQFISVLIYLLNMSIKLSNINYHDFASWTVHFVNICVKTNKCNNYSFILCSLESIPLRW